MQDTVEENNLLPAQLIVLSQYEKDIKCVQICYLFKV